MSRSTTDPTAELRHYPLERDVLLVAGADATTYLQGQLSQDVEGMAAGDSAWTFVLAPTGKVSAWFRLTKRDDDWVLDVDAGHGGNLHTRLTRFLLRTQATVDLVEWSGVALRGPGAAEVTAGEGVIAVDPCWAGVEGLDLLGPSVEAPDGIPAGEPRDLEALRLLAGVPVMGAELDESTIPAAAGVVERSVSFTKGCYTGQELVARINSRGGSTPTRLCGVRAADDRPLRPGAALLLDGDEIGTVTSAAVAPWIGQTVALAYIKRAVEMPADADADDGTSAVRLVELPTA